MKNKLFLLVFLFTNILHAQYQVSEEEAVKAALTEMGRGRKGDAISVLCVNTRTDGFDNVLMYEVVTSNGMAILLSGNKKYPPVLGVYDAGETSIFSHNANIPCGLQCLLNDYREQIALCFTERENDGRCDTAWQFLIDGQIPGNYNRNSVGPLLQSQWGQNYSNDRYDTTAYNQFAPDLDCDSVQRCPAGCVAVAMGQVMYYWKYPFFAAGSQTLFDWCNMSNSLITTNPCYEHNKKAINHLLKTCGRFVDMQYACAGSDAYADTIDDVLKLHFWFAPEASYIKCTTHYAFHSMMSYVENNLNDGNPVILRAVDPDYGAGHAFVCDGYADGKLHINWGWTGAFDGLYNIDALNVNDFHLSHQFGAVYNIYPQIQYIPEDVIDLTGYYLAVYQYGNYYLPYRIVPNKADTLISASSAAPLSWRTIPAGATAMYQAHEEIVLQDGFTVEAGAEFTAEIVPCPNCESNRGVAGDADGVAADEPAEMMTPSRRTPEPPQPVADLYPNPTSGEVTVSVEGEVQSVVILNMMGQPVGGWGLRAMEPGRVTIDVGPLPAGPYLVCVHTPHGTATKKLLVGAE